jgi:hypothetical protein
VSAPLSSARRASSAVNHAPSAPGSVAAAANEARTDCSREVAGAAIEIREFGAGRPTRTGAERGLRECARERLPGLGGESGLDVRPFGERGAEHELEFRARRGGKLRDLAARERGAHFVDDAIVLVGCAQERASMQQTRRARAGRGIVGEQIVLLLDERRRAVGQPEIDEDLGLHADDVALERTLILGPAFAHAVPARRLGELDAPLRLAPVAAHPRAFREFDVEHRQHDQRVLELGDRAFEPFFRLGRAPAREQQVGQVHLALGRVIAQAMFARDPRRALERGEHRTHRCGSRLEYEQHVGRDRIETRRRGIDCDAVLDLAVDGDVQRYQFVERGGGLLAAGLELAQQFLEPLRALDVLRIARILRRERDAGQGDQCRGKRSADSYTAPGQGAPEPS